MEQLFINIVGGIVGITALVVSGLALRESRRANAIAKAAPAQARNQAHRDVVRAALKAVLEPLQEAAQLLDSGRDLPEQPAALGNAYAVVGDIGKRLPEHIQMGSIESLLFGVQSNWESVVWSQDQVTQWRDWGLEWEPRVSEMEALGKSQAAENARRTRAEYENRREQAARERDALRPKLAERIAQALESSNGYLRWLNVMDRNGLDPEH